MVATIPAQQNHTVLKLFLHTQPTPMTAYSLYDISDINQLLLPYSFGQSTFILFPGHTELS